MEEDKFYDDLINTLKGMEEALSTLKSAQTDRNVITTDLLKLDNIRAKKSLIKGRNLLNVDILELCAVISNKFSELNKLCRVSDFSLLVIQDEIGYDQHFHVFNCEQVGEGAIDFMQLLNQCLDNLKDYKKLAGDLKNVEENLCKVETEVVSARLYQRFDNIHLEMDAVSDRISKNLKVILNSHVSRGNDGKDEGTMHPPCTDDGFRLGRLGLICHNLSSWFMHAKRMNTLPIPGFCVPTS